MPLVYMRYELLRTLRNRRFFLLSLGFPLILYLVIVSPSRHVRDFDNTGVSLALYYMVGMASFGTMSAMLSSGARIAAERAVGWNRQLRISPLTSRSYFRAKVLTAYMMALLSMVVLYICGASLGVSLPATDWLEMTGLILVGLAPFAALGITLGHMLTLSAILFALSVAGIFLNRKNVLLLLMCIELLLLAANFNFVAFSRYLGQLDGQIFVFFVLTVAAAESAIGLAILVVVFRERRSINVEDLDRLKG